MSGQDSSDDDEDEVEEEQRPQQKQTRPLPSLKPQVRRHPTAQQKESEDEDEEGFVTEEDEEDQAQDVEPSKSEPKSTTITKPEAGRTRHAFVSKAISEEPESEEEEADSSEEERSDSDSVSPSSSEDESQRKFQRPTFIKKSDRKPSDSTTHPQPNNHAPTLASEPSPTSATEPDATARRLATTNLLIADRITKDTQARLLGKKSWDDDDENFAPEDLVDDTDNLDPAAEHAAWKLRELHRLKRDRARIEEAEAERTERLRREALSPTARAAEDAARVAAQRDEKDASRGQTAYLARYHHKGAFFQDDSATAALLAKRDVMGARFEDEVADKAVLPEYMRIRDMTKLGKKGRTRYTDLRGEDTGDFGRGVRDWRPGDSRGAGGGPDARFGGGGGAVDERFLSERERERLGNQGPTGANASLVGPRRVGRRSRSRSRSQEREGERGRRKRSPSPASPIRDADKRRRVETVS